MKEPKSSGTVPLPLSGIRVLDLTRVLAGPYCTMILADLGAEVVKVERPEVGDDSRHFGPFLSSGLSAYFASINRGKKSVVLDLKEESERDTFLKLVRVAGVLVENFRPGTLESLGLGPQRLREINPRLVHASASGFGGQGLHGRRPAYDIIVQAMSGLMSVTGTDAKHPVRVGTSISDILTGMFTAIGILAALRRRDQAGIGAELDMAMLDCTVAALENAISRYEVTGRVPEPLGTQHPSITPFQAFEARDGAMVVAAGNDALWRKLCKAIGRSELAGVARFRTNDERTRNHVELESLLNTVFRQRPTAEWLTRLEANGVPCAPIRDMADIVTDEHLAVRGMLHVMRDGEGAAFKTAGSPLRMDRMDRGLSDHAPDLGEHTESVLEDWLVDE